MATNKYSEGKVFAYTATGGEASGGIKIFGDMAGINLAVAPTGEKNTAAVAGAWTLPKATGSVCAQGGKAWTDGAIVAPAAATGLVPIGNFAEDAGAGVAEVPVKLNSW